MHAADGCDGADPSTPLLVLDTLVHLAVGVLILLGLAAGWVF